ncbi:MAG: capsular polysaccharide biosynthesis protein Cps4F [Anaerocolumna sp.]|jgi:glycosyltransferase involved in cell wall biosynthesis|nr:capsular polysaccharide biosynthesis protein Cps4F [Anaerocolumna sp.]
MKILFICQYYYPDQFKINDICSGLVEQGYEITVLTGLPNYPSGVIEKEYKNLNKRVEIIDGVKVIRSWLIGRGQGNIKLALNYLSFAFSASIKSLFIKKDFDLIFVYQLSPVTMALPGILLRKITRKPLILYCFDLWPESVVSGSISTESFIYKVLLKVSSWIYRQADMILTSSKQFEQYFNNTLGIHNELNYFPIYAESLFDNIGKNDDNNVNFVFAGNIGEMQSVETIVYAANELREDKNIKIHIVGDGSSRKSCEQLSTSLHLDNVIFYGHRPITEMPIFYEIADAFLVTLKDNRFISYTLPGKVQTYMASGKPIIGAINGETKVIIEEANCGLCALAEDYKELANIIRRFIKEKDKHSLYGDNAKKYYDINFSKKVYMERLNELLQNSI